MECIFIKKNKKNKKEKTTYDVKSKVPVSDLNTLWSQNSVKPKVKNQVMWGDCQTRRDQLSGHQRLWNSLQTFLQHVSRQLMLPVGWRITSAWNQRFHVFFHSGLSLLFFFCLSLLYTHICPVQLVMQVFPINVEWMKMNGWAFNWPSTYLLPCRCNKY